MKFTISYDVILMISNPAGCIQWASGPETTHDDDDGADNTDSCHTEGDDHG